MRRTPQRAGDAQICSFGKYDPKFHATRKTPVGAVNVLGSTADQIPIAGTTRVSLVYQNVFYDKSRGMGLELATLCTGVAHGTSRLLI